MNYNLLKVFIKVAEFGSFTQAARQLNQPKSRVSRSIVRLEEDLKVELIKRTTRSITLTQAGQSLYRETHNLIKKLDQKIESVTAHNDQISGTLSISAPIDFGEYIMPNILCEFSKLHPEVNFKILLSDAYTDLIAHDIDIALRVGKLKDSSLKHKKLGDAQLVLAASKEYINLKGSPKKWEDFQDHQLLSFYNENHQDPLESFYQTFSISPMMRVNSFPMLKQLALGAKGIAVLPSTLCKEEFDKKTLVRIMPNWGHEKSPLQVVFSAHRNLSSKTRAFINFISENKKSFF